MIKIEKSIVQPTSTVLVKEVIERFELGDSAIIESRMDTFRVTLDYHLKKQNLADRKYRMKKFGNGFRITRIL